MTFSWPVLAGQYLHFTNTQGLALYIIGVRDSIETPLIEDVGPCGSSIVLACGTVSVPHLSYAGSCGSIVLACGTVSVPSFTKRFRYSNENFGLDRQSRDGGYVYIV